MDGKDCHCQCKCCNGIRSNKYYVSRHVRLFTKSHIYSIRKRIYTHTRARTHKHIKQTHTHNYMYKYTHIYIHAIPMHTLISPLTSCLQFWVRYASTLVEKSKFHSLIRSSNRSFYPPFECTFWLCAKIEQISWFWHCYEETQFTFKRCRWLQSKQNE